MKIFDIIMASLNGLIIITIIALLISELRNRSLEKNEKSYDLFSLMCPIYGREICLRWDTIKRRRGYKYLVCLYFNGKPDFLRTIKIVNRLDKAKKLAQKLIYNSPGWVATIYLWDSRNHHVVTKFGSYGAGIPFDFSKPMKRMQKNEDTDHGNKDGV